MVAHALSTEKQEVMGLLFGRWDGPQAFIEEAHPLARTDRRADRVEVKPEQLAKAASIAESRGLRIVGWYHSHPHITAAPSHVDVRTQRAYQVLDDRFVGIIAACFPGVDGAAAARGAPAVTLAAFQARSTSEPGAFAAPLALPVSPPPAYATVEATSVPVTTEAHAGRDVPLSIASAETPGALATALRGLASLQDALLAEEVAARRARLRRATRTRARFATRSSARPLRYYAPTRSILLFTSPARGAVTNSAAATRRSRSGTGCSRRRRRRRNFCGLYLPFVSIEGRC